jgi:DNA topoisomerase-1
MDGENLTLDQALRLLSLPREIGLHPETKEKIEAGIGRFGPYVKMGAVFGSLDRDDDVLALGLNRAVDLLAKKMASVRTIGTHPTDKDLISVRKGRFGPYVQHGKTVANLPRGMAMDEISLDDAVKLLAEKGKALKPRGAIGRRGKAGSRAAVAEAAATRKEAGAEKASQKARTRTAVATSASPKSTSPKKAAAKKTSDKKITSEKTPAKGPRTKTASAKAAVKTPRRAAE